MNLFGSQAGIVLDTSAITHLRESVFLRTVIRQHMIERRPVVIPTQALLIAAWTSPITAKELQLPGLTITAIAEFIDEIVEHGHRHALTPDIAHVHYESVHLGHFPIVTANPATYAHLPEPPDLITLP
ncbi:hypothetical protein [Nocardia brasiliensis]|uniref:hypothetical protein n=1 Tax=Nocardia brasiliensis TaxID=37326 RepID=UPI002453E26E|nr:hypothetical protein [Nocardia brasiliensis]